MVAPASAIVFDEQTFAVHDGPGIRSILFFKGCPLRCVWCANPESQSGAVELRHLAARCRGCGRCVRSCSRGALVENPLVGGPPLLERARCRECDRRSCAEACLERAWLVVGRRENAGAVFERLARDLPFFRNSGGGITFSGGEPLLWTGFMGEMLQACRRQGIHTLVETCGEVPRSSIDLALDGADLVYFDLKHADENVHLHLTGRPLGRILDNLGRALERRRQAVTVRLPIVPGIHDEESALEKMVRLLAELEPAHIQLVPYHGLGVFKYAQLGRRYQLAEELVGPADATLERWRTRLESVGLACSCGAR